MESLEILRNLLCPAGDGVFTVETAKEKKASFQTKIYGEGDPKPVWEKNIEKFVSDKKPLLLGVPSDNGGGILRGANWGPLFLRERLATYNDIGDIRVVPHLLHDSYLNEETIERVGKALFGTKTDLPVSPLSIAYRSAKEILTLNPKARIFGLGGDHSVSEPLVKAYLETIPNLGILHFDAHTDLLDERLGIDHCFATWAHQILPDLNSSENLIQVGIRRSGKERSHWEKKYKITQYWADEVLKESASEISKKIIEKYKKLKVEKIYISFDIDAIDSEFASATGTPEENGLRPHDAAIIIEEVSKHFDIVAGDMVEVAPFVNHRGSQTHYSPEPESTIDIASQLSLKILEAMEEGIGHS